MTRRYSLPRQGCQRSSEVRRAERRPVRAHRLAAPARDGPPAPLPPRPWASAELGTCQPHCRPRPIRYERDRVRNRIGTPRPVSVPARSAHWSIVLALVPPPCRSPDRRSRNPAARAFAARAESEVGAAPERRQARSPARFAMPPETLQAPPSSCALSHRAGRVGFVPRRRRTSLQHIAARGKGCEKGRQVWSVQAPCGPSVPLWKAAPREGRFAIRG